MPNSSLVHHALPLHNLSNRWISSIFNMEYKFNANQYLIHQGDSQSKIYVMLQGWAHNHKLFEDGRRQIVNFILPGDIIGLRINDNERNPYTAEATTDVKLLGIEKSLFWEKINANPSLLLQILKNRERHQRVLEKRIILLTVASSLNSMAQMLALLYSRLIAMDIPENEAKLLPINQILLSEVLGISYIHTHRVFNKLEKMRLVTRNNQYIQLVDINGLLKVSYEGLDIQKAGMKKFLQADYSVASN